MKNTQKKLITILFSTLVLGLSCGFAATKNEKDSRDWLDKKVPSILKNYEDIFDYFGIACEYGSELSNSSVQKGLAKHANSITMGNDFKPQFMTEWYSGKAPNSFSKVDFTASNGLTIKVPAKLSGKERLEKILEVCSKNNLKLRGHVLTWHSQTSDDFFAENYKAKYDGEMITNLVSKEEMTARHEWYIKTMMDYVADWEEKNGYAGRKTGEHILWAWDVVNEACADDAGKTYSGENQNWLRGSTKDTKNKSPQNGGSRWFQVYGDDEFIINAFRFATAYAPEDVVLCYNDYNEYMDWNGDHGAWKTSAILNLMNNVRNAEAKVVNGKSVKPRIDVMGMQAHVGISWPGVKGFETALQKYLTAGYDVHVTELDFSAKNADEAAKAYSEYFKMLKKYGKKSSYPKKVRNVTVWGINNENSWIYKGDTKNPLLFSKNNGKYVTTPSFDAVIEAVK